MLYNITCDGTMNMNEDKISVWKEEFMAYLKVLFWRFPVSKGKNVKLPLYLLIKHQAMRTYGGVQLQLYIFLTSALKGDEWSASDPSQFTYLIGVQVGLKCSQDAAKRKINASTGN
jgi:hypothetical protein